MTKLIAPNIIIIYVIYLLKVDFASKQNPNSRKK